MKYMLDTNIIIYAKNDPAGKVYQTLSKHDPSDICISSITMAELEYGACKSSRPEINKLALMLFLAKIRILPFDSISAAEYGKIRYDLETRGAVIGANDLLIAAHAKAAGATLVTNNLREFTRIKGLSLVNWAE